MEAKVSVVVQRSGGKANRSDHGFTRPLHLSYTHTLALQRGLPLDSKYVLKYASKPSVLVHPNRHVQADKAPQRQLISH